MSHNQLVPHYLSIFLYCVAAVLPLFSSTLGAALLGLPLLFLAIMWILELSDFTPFIIAKLEAKILMATQSPTIEWAPILFGILTVLALTVYADKLQINRYLAMRLHWRGGKE